MGVGDKGHKRGGRVQVVVLNAVKLHVGDPFLNAMMCYLYSFFDAGLILAYSCDDVTHPM